MPLTSARPANAIRIKKYKLQIAHIQATFSPDATRSASLQACMLNQTPRHTAASGGSCCNFEPSCTDKSIWYTGQTSKQNNAVGATSSHSSNKVACNMARPALCMQSRRLQNRLRQTVYDALNYSPRKRGMLFAL